MSVLLIFICLILVFLNISCISKLKKAHIFERALYSFLILFVVLLFITETLSLFKIINFHALFLGWLLFLLVNYAILFLKRKQVKEVIFNELKCIKKKIESTSKIEKLGLSIIFLFLILIFLQGVFYPPNNWDSMTYHMSRVANWIAQQSVNYYPTNIIRQLYQPPFAEYIILNFNILSFSDYLSNSVQFFFLIFSIFPLVLILKFFGLNRKYQILSCILLITIPEVILQASNTKNDIVVSFFILSSIYFVLKLLKEKNIIYFIFLGLSVGLGLLTKGTAYIYLVSAALPFGVFLLVQLYRTKQFFIIGYSIITVLIAIVINSTHYMRNYNLSKSILGVETSKYANEEMSPSLLASNIVKNIGLHVGPYALSEFSAKAIIKLHQATGVALNNPKTSYGKTVFKAGKLATHEDLAPNLFHLFLITFSLIILVINYRHKVKYQYFYISIILLQGLIFCLYLKWQPWHTRLHAPLFVSSIPLIAIAISSSKKYYRIVKLITPLVIIYGFLILIFNSSRPYFTVKKYTSLISIHDNRYKKYFSNRMNRYNEFKEVTDFIDENNYYKIGLMLNDDGWEYPLFSQSIYSKPIKPIHLKIRNYSKTLSLDKEEASVNCVISDRFKDSLISYKGMKFKNITPQNKFIWIYKKIK
jgi:4-amino-4-deoxy-L-arabinose transferase-like glycosyltransferase